MNHTLEDLWYGNICPYEQSTENNKEIKNLISLMGRNRDDLCETMTDKQKDILEKYDDCVNEMYGIIEKEAFAYGFRLGGDLMLEIISGSDKE